MKYRKAYEWGRARLEMAKIDEASLDARLLLEFVCGTSRNDLYAHSERELSESEEEKYRSLILKRTERIPLQHLTGEQEFMGLRIKVNEHVLVPRQDTEILAEEGLIAVNDGDRILDMCTGSGCILLSIMRYKNDVTGVGADLSADALAVARENYENHRKEISGRADFVQGDLFENVEGRFDVILSNPPYIRSEVIESLAPEVKDHDPMMALDGGTDGLIFYQRIVEEAPRYLKAEGKLLMEIGFDQAADVRQLLENGGFTEVKVIKDLAGLNRVVCARLMEERN